MFLSDIDVEIFAAARLAFCHFVTRAVTGSVECNLDRVKCNTVQRSTVRCVPRSMLRQGEPFILGALGAGVGRAGGGGADGWMFDCGGRRIESMFRHGEPPLYYGRGGGGGRFSPPLPGGRGGGRWLCGGR